MAIICYSLIWFSLGLFLGGVYERNRNNKVVESDNSLQQLQAKIAALATRVEASYTVETPLKELSAIVYEMRQLSAVQ